MKYIKRRQETSRNIAGL